MNHFYKERSQLYELKADDCGGEENVVPSESGTKRVHGEEQLKSL